MADTPVSVDGLTTTPSDSVPTPSPKPATSEPLTPAVQRWEKILLVGAAALYILYIMWAFGLMSVLPSANLSLRPLVFIGLLSAAVASLIFAGIGALLILHISKETADTATRKRGLMRLLIFCLPGILLSGLMAFVISQEPPVTIDIIEPASSQDWIAPVSMTFSVEKALTILALSNFHPIDYKWDINGDRKTDQETVVPTLTATYDQQGVYTLSVTMIGSNGTTRTISRRFVILTSVFGVTPSIPIVGKPVIFSIAGLVKDPSTVTQTQWDFDGDGKIDDTNKTVQSTYTYYKTGSYKVSVIVDLQNKTEETFQRTIAVQNPQPLPFPVDIKNEPSHLIGSAPFAVLFSIDTKEPIAEVDWDFGDGQQGTGNRVAHTYGTNGNYAVVAKVRSSSGVTATLNSAVQVVDALNLPDLSFEGTPQPNGDAIEGEVPLTLNLTPHSNTAFVQYSWEAPDATEVGSTDTNLQAIYRRVGTYTLTLIAQDLNNHVLRKSFKVTVDPPSALVDMTMNPETGIAPLIVNFDASSTSIPGDDPTGFTWDFGDGTPALTQGANVSHTYSIPKTYTITLTVQTVSGKSYKTTSTLVVRAPVLAACMTRSKENVQAGSSVQFFSDCTTGTPANYLWDFGDNAQSTDKNPVHLYAQAGTYNVQLTIDDGAGHQNTTSTSLTVQP